LSIDEIAKNLFLNYSYLCFAFKKDTGLTINDYITEYRIEKAKGLFDNGNTLITNVAYNVGYSDSNYFGKCFKKRIGMSPSNYVKNIGKN
jgi:two-component system, response regulator YesN